MNRCGLFLKPVWNHLGIKPKRVFLGRTKINVPYTLIFELTSTPVFPPRGQYYKGAKISDWKVAISLQDTYLVEWRVDDVYHFKIDLYLAGRYSDIYLGLEDVPNDIKAIVERDDSAKEGFVRKLKRSKLVTPTWEPPADWNADLDYPPTEREYLLSPPRKAKEFRNKELRMK